MRYFKGAFTLDQVLWETSWVNYNLFLASTDDSDEEESKPALEVRDAADLF